MPTRWAVALGYRLLTGAAATAVIVGAVGLVGAIGVLVGRRLCSQTVAQVSPPRLVTVWDTVARLDTLWRTRWRASVQWDTVLTERVIVSQPETVYVMPEAVGMTLVQVPATVGDSTVVEGFALRLVDSTVERRDWRARYWTAGPLRELSADTLPPRIRFDPPSAREPVRRSCGFFCRAQTLVLGVSLGYGSCRAGL